MTVTPIVLQSARLRCRSTTEADLDFVLTSESHPDNRPFVGQWTRAEHQSTLTDPNMAHLIGETIDDSMAIGYVILKGRMDPNQVVLVQRLVITQKGQGYGKELLRLIQAFVFDQCNAHRLWLDVKTHNARAQHVYRSLGFVEEGTMRECIKTDHGYESLMILSLLAHEYAAICDWQRANTPP